MTEFTQNNSPQLVCTNLLTQHESNVRARVCVCVCVCVLLGTSLVAQMIKNLPAMRESQIQSLGWEDPLEKGTVTHSSNLAWRIQWTEEPGELQSTG